MAERQSDVTIIPASKRPDGTWRKEIRVKAGYVPPDEVERYQSKGREFNSGKSSLPPGMSADEPKKTKNQKKNERKKLKKQEMAAKSSGEETNSEILATSLEKIKVNEDEGEKLSKETLTKKLKNLKKKLRQIEDLEKKDVKELTKEQLEKITRKKEIVDEIDEIELDLKLCDC